MPMKIASVINVSILILLLAISVNADDLHKIKQAIRAQNASWKAGENKITHLSPSERLQLLGAIDNPLDLALAPLVDLPEIKDLPSHLDWRENNGNWVTPVKYQGLCGSCWDFSAVAQIESWWKIIYNQPDSMIDLSEQFVLSCSGAGSCDGGSAAMALEYVKNFGIPSELCFPYQANDAVSCEAVCDNWEGEAVSIPGWGWVTREDAIIENIKIAVSIHPVSSYFKVYEDFWYYDGDVYEHVWGDEAGGHLILIIGWDDAEQSWICKNSWGEDWGEDGYFRIKWGECLIGTRSPFIWSGLADAESVSISPNHFDVQLDIGDSTSLDLKIENYGIENLEFAATVFAQYALQGTNHFHPDDFLAWDGLSWWSGDTAIFGYSNSSLQYLETHPLNLTGTTSPQLSWMGFWSIEEPSELAPWDGWDGCNVWISVDGGISYEVLFPVTPSYDCYNLYSFGNPNGWNLGDSIPGWAGNCSQWQPVVFDLSSYKYDHVIIRWAFASDEAICTIDDPSIFGFFIDEIMVADGETIIYENYADDSESMYTRGYSFNSLNFISLSNSTGWIPTNDSAMINVHINATNLESGEYYGAIYVQNNAWVDSMVIIPVNLQVQPLGIQSEPDFNNISNWKLFQNYPNPFNPSTTFSYQLPASSLVELSIYNMLGQKVVTLVNKKQTAGSYYVKWDAKEFASGVYIYRLETENYSQFQKCLLIK